MRRGVLDIGWAMPAWLCGAVYFAAAGGCLLGFWATGIGAFAVIPAIAAGYVAVWTANRLWLLRSAHSGSEEDQPTFDDEELSAP